MYTLGTGLAVVSYTGYVERPAAHGAWLALVAGVFVTAPTALTGFFDWVMLEWSSPPWRTATAHLSAMLSATALLRWPHGGTTPATGPVASRALACYLP